MDNAPQIALAAACLGYREANDPTPLTDWMWVNSPALMEEMPFILTIPEDRILGAGYGDLYCLVPRDDNTTLAVNHVKFGLRISFSRVHRFIFMGGSKAQIYA